ncbi:MAG: glycosyltransferase family 39 protein [Planctomycetia bacterium]|nr:glycosyltransferase family 39 protein [Planctomycetia bacterium]
MDELPATRPIALCDLLPLLPIIVLATILRLWQINESLWLDELHSAWAISGGIGEIVERAQIGNQSPLYFYLPWVTTSLFGMSEWALRLPSLVAGVGLVMLAYAMAFEFTRSRAAACACATLAALDHNFLFYSTETRPYACVQLIAALQLLIFWRLQVGASAWRRVLFVASTALLFYLHYTAILLVAGEVVYLLVRQWYRNKEYAYKWRAIAVDLLCVAAMTLPVAVHVLDVGSRREAWASFINDTSWMLPVYWFSLDSYLAAPFIACLVVRVCNVAITLRRDEPATLGSNFKATFNHRANVLVLGSSPRSVTAIVLLVCWFVTPLVIVWLLTVTDAARLYLGRYVIGAALAPILLAGMCVAACGSRKLQATVTSVIIAYAVYSSGMIQQCRFDGRLFADRAENWRNAVSYVNANWIRDEVVFVRSGLLEADRLPTDKTALLQEYCVSPLGSIYKADQRASAIRPLTTSSSGRLTDEDIEVIEQTGAAWFVINGTAATREHCLRQVLDSVAGEGGRGQIVKQQEFGLVGAYLLLLDEVDVFQSRSDGMRKPGTRVPGEQGDKRRAAKRWQA